jgi:hypothetical protein
LGDIANAKKLFHRLEQIDTINRLAFNQLSAIYELEKMRQKQQNIIQNFETCFPKIRYTAVSSANNIRRLV